MAVLALAGTLAVGEAFAGARITVMLASRQLPPPLERPAGEKVRSGRSRWLSPVPPG